MIASSRWRPRRRGRAALLTLILLLAAASLQGCAAIRVERHEKPLVTASWRASALTHQRLSPRSLQVLRRYDLAGLYPDRLAEASGKLHAEAVRDPQADMLFALSELSYLRGLKTEESSPADASIFYYLAAGYAYHYLFDDPPSPAEGSVIQPVAASDGAAATSSSSLAAAPAQGGQRADVFDPRFRLACDLYNAGLAKCIALAQKVGQLDPRRRLVLPGRDGQKPLTLAVVHTGFGYRADEFGPVALCSDYQVVGLANHHRTYGLGVPLIGSRDPAASRPTFALYPPRVNFPMTAFFRFQGGLADLAERRAGWLELFNPLSVQTVQVASKTVPLETDLTTPLAHFLAGAGLDSAGYAGFFCPDGLRDKAGLYALGPYEPGKVPVVLVHGLFGTPLTWAPMFNDLQADPVLRRRCQFWVYFYPTGQPYLTSAATLREELVRLRKGLDPHGKDPSLSEMVFVGHSMGGLVSRLMTIQGGDDFWGLVSPAPLDRLRLQPTTRTELRNTFYFDRQSFVTRAIFLGTPHRGSKLSPSVIGRIGSRFAGLPRELMNEAEDLTEDNPEVAASLKGKRLPNSVDLLAPDSPALQLIAHRPRPKEVRYHSVIGVSPNSHLLIERLFGGGYSQPSDGVVPYTSAHLADANSEVVVEADHYKVHQHALSILEVRRILLEHLKEVDQRHQPEVRQAGAK